MPEMKTQTINGVTYEIVDQVGRADLEAHIDDQNNPHKLTAEQIGAVGPDHGNHVPTTQTADNATFLRNDNTWQKVTPANIGAAASSHGNHVPDTQTADNATFLRNDNTWQKVTPANIGAVPTSRTVNGKALSGNITLSASDVGAAASSHGNHVPDTQTASSKVFLRNDNTWQTVTPANIGAVPTSRTVNSKALSSNISLTASDVGAVPTSRTVNGKTLSANISLTAANVGAVSITSVWTNSSPTSQFNAQSISKTLSSYDAVLIQARTHIGDYDYGSTETSLIVRVGGSGMIMDASESGSYLVSRKVTVTTSKITFASAKYPSTYAATSLTEGNRNLVPTYIYGINW